MALVSSTRAAILGSSGASGNPSLALGSGTARPIS
jgi:hypothetical protein